MSHGWLQRLGIWFAALLSFHGGAPVAPTTVNINISRPAARAAAFAPNYARSVEMKHLWRWPRFPLRVFIAGHNDQERAQARVAIAGFDEWVTATHGAVRYKIVNTPTEADLTVRFTTDDNIDGVQGVVGETKVAGRSGVLAKASMRLATGGANDADLQIAAAHEFGHALGIGGHSHNPADLMYPSQIRYFSWDGSPVPTPRRPITKRDVNTLRVCYPDLARLAS